MLVKALVKTARSAYHGLTPNIRAITKPMAGYQATNPMCEKRTISGRFRSRYSSTNDRETRAWRVIVRREYMNSIPGLSGSFGDPCRSVDKRECPLRMPCKLRLPTGKHRDSALAAQFNLLGST